MKRVDQIIKETGEWFDLHSQGRRYDWHGWGSMTAAADAVGLTELTFTLACCDNGLHCPLCPPVGCKPRGTGAGAIHAWVGSNGAASRGPHWVEPQSKGRRRGRSS